MRLEGNISNLGFTELQTWEYYAITIFMIFFFFLPIQLFCFLFNFLTSLLSDRIWELKQ